MSLFQDHVGCQNLPLQGASQVDLISGQVSSENRSILSYPWLLYQKEVKCSAFDMGVILYSHGNKTHFHNKGCALGVILEVTVFGTQKWPLTIPSLVYWGREVGREI